MNEFETVGSIFLFAGNFEPVNWLFCDGRLLPISDYEMLYNQLENTYGGDGEATFALPDLRGRTPIGAVTGQSYSSLGERGGVEAVFLTVAELPEHTHKAQAVSQLANKNTPIGNLWAAESNGTTAIYAEHQPNIPMSAGAISGTGGSQPHSNMQPYLALNYIICVYGTYAA